MNARGATLAVEEINAAGGLLGAGQERKIRIVTEDNQGSPEEAVSQALRLINREDATALVGLPVSRNAIPVAIIAEKHRIPMISTLSTHPETTAGKKYVFRLAFLDSFQGRTMAGFAFDDLGARKAAILFNAASNYSTHLAEIFGDTFKEKGGHLSVVETFTTDEMDVTRQLSEIRESGAEVLFLPNFAELISQLLRQARDMGIEATLLGSDTWGLVSMADQVFPAGPCYFADFWAPDSPGTKISSFIDRFHHDFGVAPTSAAALSYDAIMMIAEAIRSQDKADSESIRRGLEAMGGYEGVSGAIRFSGSGDPLRSLFIREVTGDGRVRFHQEISP